MRQLIAGNWKMNGSLAMAGALVNALRAAAADKALTCWCARRPRC
jgi:triosephosphate isomerase